MDRSLLESVGLPALAFVGIAIWRARHPEPGARIPGWRAAVGWAIGMLAAIATGVATVGAFRSSDGWAALLPLLLALGAFSFALICLAGLTWVVIARLFGREPPPLPDRPDEDDDPPPEAMAARLARLRLRSKAPSPLDRGMDGAVPVEPATGRDSTALAAGALALAEAAPPDASGPAAATPLDGSAPLAATSPDPTVPPMPHAGGTPAGMLDHLRWAAVLATTLLMTVGLGKGVLDGLRSGHLRLGRRSAGLLFSQSPVGFGLVVAVMVALAVGLLLLSLVIWRDGPALLARRMREARVGRLNAGYRRRPSITVGAVVLRMVVGGLAMLAFAPFARVLSVLVGSSVGGPLAGLWNLVVLCWIGHGFWRLGGRR